MGSHPWLRTAAPLGLGTMKAWRCGDRLSGGVGLRPRRVLEAAAGGGTAAEVSALGGNGWQQCREQGQCIRHDDQSD
jgi:hypothetical protein